MLYRKVPNAKLAALGDSTLRGRGGAIRPIAPRRVAVRPRISRWVVYTDAATQHPNPCALLFDASSPDFTWAGQWAADASAPWCCLFRRTTLIFGPELLALVAFFGQISPRLEGKCV